MTAVQFLQFTSAATGLCLAVAMIRGFVARSQNLGNFYTDFVRSLTRLLLPFCFVAALIFVGLGVPQTIGGYQTVSTVEGATQTILVGPVSVSCSGSCLERDERLVQSSLARTLSLLLICC